MEILTYQNWSNDIKTSLTDLKSKIDQNEIAKSLYGGFYVWDSKYIENPEIMSSKLHLSMKIGTILDFVCIFLAKKNCGWGRE